MKNIFSIILPLLLLGGGITLAFNVQDENPCLQLGHTGYDYTGPNATPAIPLDPGEDGLTPIGTYGMSFRCQENPPSQCHWAYVPASSEEEAKWVECPGNRQLPPFQD